MNTQDNLNQIRYLVETADLNRNKDKPHYDIADYQLRRAQALAILSIAESLDSFIREFMTPKAIVK